MSDRTVSLPEPVYERLHEEKREGESFGDVIDRLLGRTERSEFWGAWSDETSEVAREAVVEGRARSEDCPLERFE